MSREEGKSVIRRVELGGVGSNIEKRAWHSGPDLRTTTLQFRTSDGHVFEITSWHEFIEEDGEYPVAARTPEYREFIQVWESLRATINELLPQDLKPVADPDFLFRNIRTGQKLKRRLSAE